jgi:dethiobiotin synthetase
VVGLRLGCINHSVLSADCIMEKGCGFAGWIANRIDPAMLRVAENLAALDGAIPAPRLGLVEHMPNPRDSRALVPMLDRTRLSALVAH